MTEPQEGGHDMAELRSELARLPRPELPLEVAARLDAAIARAVAERASSGTGAPVSEPPRASYGFRAWFSRFKLAAAGVVVVSAALILAVSLGLSRQPPAPEAGTSALGTRQSDASAAGSGTAALSTAPVTDPALLSWAASTLQHHSGPLVAPGDSSEQPQFGFSDPAVTPCLQSAESGSAGVAGRRILSASAGQYNGQSAILVAYSNGDDPSTAFIVVFAAPCKAAGATVLASGIVPR
jgi:hypothetical protein